jgi:pimeloyl-ACP methyl ester carboxylesterase
MMALIAKVGRDILMTGGDPGPMTTAAATHTERTVQVAGKNVRLLQGGSGPSAVFLHHSTGNPGWLPIHELLAENYSLTVPDLPGYGQSERPEWAREPRDVALLTNRILDKLGLRDVTLIGAGLGGFIAAEMAAANASRLKRLVLIGAAGLQPDEGEIADQMLVDFAEYMKAGFSDDAAYEHVFGHTPDPAIASLWDFSREMTARITWKPYMFSRRLPRVLGEIEVPTLVIWGGNDRVVPISCADQYIKGLANARLEVVAGAGHLVELEEPEKVASLIGR